MLPTDRPVTDEDWKELEFSLESVLPEVSIADHQALGVDKIVILIDFPWIVEQLDAAGYEGDFALEYELHSPGPEEGLKRFYDDFAAMF